MTARTAMPWSPVWRKRLAPAWMACIFALAATPTVTAGDAPQAGAIPLAELSLAELSQVRVVTATKVPTALEKVPAAVFVITHEDIAASGASTLMDLLRMVPGAQVAQVNTDFWAISIRGFNGTLANKVLVLIDGRSVYTPLYSNVFWREHGLVLEDIERIEVIRGPGGTVWGANAVNGVINIITKHASETQGGLVTAYGGEKEGGVSARYGDRLGPHAFYRLYGIVFRRDRMDAPPPGADPTQHRIPSDHWRYGRFGARFDWQPAAADDLSLEVGSYLTQVHSFFPAESLGPPTDWPEDTERTVGVFVRADWRRTLSPEADLTLRTYYDHQDYDIPSRVSRQHTFDLDTIYHRILGDCNSLTLGAGYRLTVDKYTDTATYLVRPGSDDMHTVNLFAQDEARFLEDRLILTFGSKLEHNDLTGFEYQPGVRLLVVPARHHTLWCSATRAVKTPNRLQEDVAGIGLHPPPPDHPSGPSELAVEEGNPNIDAEVVHAYEAGYRLALGEALWLDATAFYNEYDGIATIVSSPGVSALETNLFAPLLEDVEGPLVSMTHRLDNVVYGHGRGFELAAVWKATPRWSLHGAYTHTKLSLHSVDPSLPPQTTEDVTTPEHAVSLRSLWRVTDALDLDVWLRCVDEIFKGNTPAYTTGDVQVSWRPCPDLKLALIGQNVLFDQGHREFQDFEVDRRVIAKATWLF